MFQQVLQPATCVRIFHTIRQGYSFRSKSEKERVPSNRSLFSVILLLVVIRRRTTASPFPPTLSQTLNTGQKTCSKAILHHGMNHLPQCIWMTSDGRSRSAQGLSRNIPDLPAQFEEGRFLFRFPIESREKKVSLQRFRHQPLPKQRESAKVHI